jgi:hypothetical protein
MSTDGGTSSQDDPHTPTQLLLDLVEHDRVRDLGGLSRST